MMTFVTRSLSFGLLLLTGVTAMAQQPWEPDFIIGVGGGLSAYDNGAFSRRLKSYTPVRGSGENFLYQTEDFPTTGWTVGGNLGTFLGSNLFLGISGQQVFYRTIYSINGPGNPRDEYTLTGRGGGLDIGWTAYRGWQTIVMPYLHGGYYGYSLDYSNNQSEAVPFFQGVPVAAGSSATYTGYAPRMALGIELVHLLAEGDGAILPSITARLDWGMMLSRPQWNEPDGSLVDNGGLTPAYNGVSLSVAIGGAFGR